MAKKLDKLKKMHNAYNAQEWQKAKQQQRRGNGAVDWFKDMINDKFANQKTQEEYVAKYQAKKEKLVDFFTDMGKAWVDLQPQMEKIQEQLEPVVQKAQRAIGEAAR